MFPRPGVTDQVRKAQRENLGTHLMLNSRYDNDGKPILELNPLQLGMKHQIERKVASGHYAFEESPCPVCTTIDFDPLSRKDRYGLYLQVVVCRGCGLVQTSPRMTQEAFHEFYNTEYRPMYGGTCGPGEEFFQSQFARGRRIHRFLDSAGLFRQPTGKTVLEIGCGAGGVLEYFRKQGCKVYGVDLGQEFCEYGRQRHGLDLHFGTIDDVNPAARPDLIIYSHVLEHIPAIRTELEKVHRLLPDDGIVYVEVPGILYLHRSYRMDFLRYLQNAHVYHFTLTSLTNLMSGSGFRRIAGTELVASAFGKCPPGTVPGAIRNEYPEVVDFLHRLEMLRRILPVPPYMLKTMARKLLLGTMDRLGILGPVRKWFAGRS